MRRAVGKENAVEMVDLVAEAAGGKAGAFDLKRVAVPILCADFDMVRTLDDAVPLRQAQTALAALLLAVPFYDLGVHELDKILVLPFRDVGFHHNAGAADNADLRRGEADTVRLRKRLLHIVQQLMQPLVEGCIRTADLPQRRVFLSQNISKRHSIHSIGL